VEARYAQTHVCTKQIQVAAFAAFILDCLHVSLINFLRNCNGVDGANTFWEKLATERVNTPVLLQLKDSLISLEADHRIIDLRLQ